MGDALSLMSHGFRVRAWIDMKVRKFSNFQIFPNYADFGEL